MRSERKAEWKVRGENKKSRARWALHPERRSRGVGLVAEGTILPEQIHHRCPYRIPKALKVEVGLLALLRDQGVDGCQPLRH